MDKVKGSMEALSAMQITADTKGFDAECKALLHTKEVLAIILKETLDEYKDCTPEEIMEFIEADSMEETKEVSVGRTNTAVRGDSAEFASLNEKISVFDILFRAKNPLLSEKGILVNLHIDIEAQKAYKPGYPIEKRGIYYLARSLSAQLSLATDRTDYGELEKCCSIWICRDDIPPKEQYSISFYEITNVKNIGKCGGLKENFDLMKLVVIRLGNKVYNGEKDSEGYRLLHFLNLLMYPHREDFMESVSEYIDFSDSASLWKEKTSMFSMSQCIFEDGVKKGIQQGMQEGIQQGMQEGMQVLVRDHLEMQIPRERTIAALQKYFHLPEEQANRCYERFSKDM